MGYGLSALDLGLWLTGELVDGVLGYELWVSGFGLRLIGFGSRVMAYGLDYRLGSMGYGFEV